jgi:hypothetical protein
MTSSPALQELYAYYDQHRNRQTHRHAVHSWLSKRACDGKLTTEDLELIVAEALPQDDFEHFTPSDLIDFIVQLTSKKKQVESILDPTCGSGLLLAKVATAHDAQIIHGCELNVDIHRIAAALLGEAGQVWQGDCWDLRDTFRQGYDLIVSQPPFGFAFTSKVDLGGWEPPRQDMGLALVVWAATRLSEHGMGVFIVSPSFMTTNMGLQVQKALHSQNGYLKAIIHLPAKTFPHTSIDSYLLIIERGEQRPVFIGSLPPDPQDRSQLLANLAKRKAGSRPELGRLCALEDFRGFPAFEAAERMRRLAREAGWTGTPANEIIIACEMLGKRRDNSLQHGPQSCYLRARGAIRASGDLEELVDGRPRRLQHVLHLQLNGDLVDPNYFAHWLNDSQIGQATLSAIAHGSTMKTLYVADFTEGDLLLYIPPVPEQRQALEGMRHLQRIRAAADELEGALWSGTGATDDLVHQIATINQEDRYEDWIESLPFPLASILWRHHAGGGSARERYEVLLHFFEAMAAFIATIHLSAFMADDERWADEGLKLHQRMHKQHLSLDRATFGAWKLVVESLGGACGALLKDGSSERAERLYGTTNRRVLQMIASPELRKVFQEANKIRNDWSGHAGVVSAEQAQQVHERLVALVQNLRGIFGRSWSGYELIQPGASRYKGGVHHVAADRLMGTRSAPFEQVERESSMPLESDALYLFDPMDRTGLLLRPFVRVMPSPEKRANACFIFNRREGAGSRYVSYHFEQESDITAAFPDLDDALNRLHLFDGEQ